MAVEFKRFLPFPKRPKGDTRKSMQELPRDSSKRMSAASLVFDPRSSLVEGLSPDMNEQMKGCDEAFVERNRIP